VLERYKRMGYNFVVITDHNRADTVEHVPADVATSTFVPISGEEVTYYAAARKGDKPFTPVHVNAICETRDGAPVPAIWAKTVSEALNDAVGFVHEHPGALAQINHPNFGWALKYDDIHDLEGPLLMEIANQHQAAHNEGNATHPPVEALWDHLLSHGVEIYGVASDDMHALNQGHGEKWARPGHGWVQVAADSLTPKAITDALAQGRFYSSTGVALDEIRTSGNKMTIKVHPASPEDHYITEFIGKDGRILASAEGLEATYELKGDEGYVRARVTGTRGKAWVQPVRVASPQPAYQPNDL
jgi:hypothetical protein